MNRAQGSDDEKDDQVSKKGQTSKRCGYDAGLNLYFELPGEHYSTGTSTVAHMAQRKSRSSKVIIPIFQRAVVINSFNPDKQPFVLRH